MRYRLAIFDCDGVLVNTEPLYFAMNRDFIRAHGGDFDFSYYEHFVGLSADLIWAELKAAFSLPQEVHELIRLEKERKRIVLEMANLHPAPGLLEFLDLLAESEIPCAVASSGRRDNVELVLRKSGLAARFAAVICGEDVERGKPAPDIFLKAAAVLRTAPADCLVIEDSRNGCLAAEAAGMYGVGYLNPDSGKQDLSAAKIIIQSFTDQALVALCRQ